MLTVNFSQCELDEIKAALTANDGNMIAKLAGVLGFVVDDHIFAIVVDDRAVIMPTTLLDGDVLNVAHDIHYQSDSPEIELTAVLEEANE